MLLSAEAGHHWSQVCTSYETPVDEVSEEDEEQEAWDFSSFRVLVLRRGSTIMSVGTLRCVVFRPGCRQSWVKVATCLGPSGMHITSGVQQGRPAACSGLQFLR